MDWIQIIIFVVIFLFPMISKILGGGDAKNQKPVRRQPRPQRPVGQKNIPQRGGNPGRPAGGAQNALEREIEDFLNRSRGGKKQKKTPTAKPVEEKKSVRRLSEVPKSIKEQQGTPQHQHARESVAEHVERHIKSDPVSAHSRELGKEVGHADESMEDHLHEVFDHDVGSLTHGHVSGEIPEGTDAAVWETSESKRLKTKETSKRRTQAIVEMLRKPESVQHAIILGEVMNRPDFD